MPDQNPANIICLKTQKAFQGFLKAAALPERIPVDNVFRGLTGARNVLPCVIAQCEMAEHNPGLMSGHWIARPQVIVRQSADDAGESATESQEATVIDEDTHLIDAGMVFDLFMNDLVPDALSRILNDFTVFQIVPISQAYTMVGDNWESEMEFEILCCGSRIE